MSKVRVSPFLIREKVTKDQLVKIQIDLWCTINGKMLTELERVCLCVLVMNPGVLLPDLCIVVASIGAAKTAQSARNAYEKLSEKEFISKAGKNKKKVSLVEGLQIYSGDSILLTYELLHVNDTTQS